MSQALQNLILRTRQRYVVEGKLPGMNGSQCVYRDQYGNRCAIGAELDDNDIQLAANYCGSADMLLDENTVPAIKAPHLRVIPSADLNILQACHDEAAASTGAVLIEKLQDYMPVGFFHRHHSVKSEAFPVAIDVFLRAFALSRGLTYPEPANG